MAYRKTAALAGLTTSTTTTLGTISLGAPYGRVLGFKAQVYASSAKAAAGADVLVSIKLTDAQGVVFYADAADRDYATGNAKNYIAFGQDDTSTSLGNTATDATGAAATAGASVQQVVQSPITVTVLNDATVTDYAEVSLYVEV